MTRREMLARSLAAAASVAEAGGRYPELGRRLSVSLEEGELRVWDQGRPVLAYRHRPVTGPPGTGPLFTRGAYIHPLHAPCGALLTDDFPPDHPHQRGVFFAWTKTRVVVEGTPMEPDFWNLGSGTGRVRSSGVRPLSTAAGVGFRATHLWEAHVSGAWRPVLRETWVARVHPPAFRDPESAQAAYTLDLTSRQRPLLDIELPEYRYGGMAVRCARAWVGRDTGMVLTTSAGKDMATGEGTRARWADMSGPVEDRVAGVALIEHPGNPWAPNRLRIPPDLPYYVFSPPKSGSSVLRAGREYVFRYRLVAHNGAASPARLNAAYRALSRNRPPRL